MLRRTLTGGGGLTDSGSAATLTVSPSGSDGYGGAISGPVSLAMNGTGSLNLSGALDYSGTTDVSSGTLNFQADPAQLSGITDDGQVGFPGVVNVLETVAPGATTFGHTKATVAKAENLKLRIKPDRRGSRLIRAHRRLRLTLMVSYTPTGGSMRTEVIKGIRVHGQCTAPHSGT